MARIVDFRMASGSVADVEMLRPCIAPAVFRLGGGRAGSRTLSVDYVHQVGGPVANEQLVIEWDAESFHARVAEFDRQGYAQRRETYTILAESDPDTGVIRHRYAMEMVRDEPD